MIKVGLLDKNELFRESLQFMLDSKEELTVQFSSNNAYQMQDFLVHGIADIVLVDIADLNSIEKEILRTSIHQFPETKFVVLSDSISKKLIKEFISFRISGFYSKGICYSELSNVLLEIQKNKNSIELKLGRIVKDTIIDQEFSFEIMNDQNFFTDKELAILKLICLEKTNMEIAEILGVSIRTIETHRSRMVERTDSRTIIGVLVFAFGRNIDIYSTTKNNLAV